MAMSLTQLYSKIGLSSLSKENLPEHIKTSRYQYFVVVLSLIMLVSSSFVMLNLPLIYDVPSSFECLMPISNSTSNET